MKFRTETFEEKKTRLGEWRDFFAIIPREVAPGDMRCFETIQRRDVWQSPSRLNVGVGGYFKTEYRAKNGPHQPDEVKKMAPPPPRDGSLRIRVGSPANPAI